MPSAFSHGSVLRIVALKKNHVLSEMFCLITGMTELMGQQAQRLIGSGDPYGNGAHAEFRAVDVSVTQILFEVRGPEHPRWHGVLRNKLYINVDGQTHAVPYTVNACKKAW